MKKNYYLLIAFFMLAFVQLDFAQESAKFKEYLQKNPNEEKSYKVVKDAFKNDPALDTMTNDLITWHKGLINSQVANPVQKMVEAWVKDPANYLKSKEYGKAEKAFIKVVNESFKKDDKFKKELGSDDLAKWIFNTGAFLAGTQKSFTIYDQEQSKSYRVESIIILQYTSALMNIINLNVRDDAKIAETFKSFSEKLINWINTIPADLRK